jgi:hypothetical protein
MNNIGSVAVLRKVVARVLEDASFVFTDDIDTGERPLPEGWNATGVSLSFTGGKSGVFRVWADVALVPLLAANMLGLDQESPEARDKGKDALREMVNIIAGNALTELFGDALLFSLSIPEITDAALKTVDCNREDALWLSAEGNAIVCVLDVAG